MSLADWSVAVAAQLAPSMHQGQGIGGLNKYAAGSVDCIVNRLLHPPPMQAPLSNYH